MTVRILYFAWVREQIGTEVDEVLLEGPVTLGGLVESLKLRSPGHARALADLSRLRAAINQDFAPWTAEVRAGDEVALFPPVTGG